MIGDRCRLLNVVFTLDFIYHRNCSIRLVLDVISTKMSVKSSELGSPTPSPAIEGVSPPIRSLGGATFACGGGGGGTQFRRLDKHSITLNSNPFTVLDIHYNILNFPDDRQRHRRKRTVQEGRCLSL